MAWYAATLILECSVDGGTAPNIVERQLRLIEAGTADDAFATAQKLGSTEEHEFENPYGETVRWRFLGLADLSELLEESIASGIEVWSHREKGANGRQLVQPKDRLTVFWSLAHQDVQVKDLINDEDISYIPAELGAPPEPAVG